MSADSTRPAPGTTAPDFAAPIVSADEEFSGQVVSLSDLIGDLPLVLYFYPKDDTPGCTTQACELRDNWAEVQKLARVFGVSVDPLKSHEKFIAKHSLPFPLISDENKEIVEKYGVWVEKSMYGKKYFGTERTSFVIGSDGKIAAVLEKIAPAQHLAALRKVLA